MSNSAKQVSRRAFLRTGAVSAAAFSLVPSRVVGADGQSPPSEKLNIAGIGVGGLAVALGLARDQGSGATILRAIAPRTAGK